MKHTRIPSRVLALVMALTMVFGLAASAYAADDAVSAELVVNIEDSTSLSAKIAFSVEEAALSIGAGMAASSMNLTAYLSTQALALESGLLDQAYGFDLTNLAENLENSVFNPNSGSTYALDEDTYNQIMDIVSGDAFTQDTDAAAEVDTDALSNAISTLAPVLVQAGVSALGKVTATQAETTVTVNGEEIAVNQTQLTGDNDTIIALWDSMLTSLESDTEVQSAVAELIDAYSAMSGEDSTVTGTEAVQSILDNMDEVRQSMTEEMNGTPVTVTVTIATTTDSEQLVQAGVDMTVDGEPNAIAVSVSPEHDFLLLEIANGETTGAIQYAVTQDSDDAFGFRVSLFSGETEAYALTLLLDKAEKTFEAGYIDTENSSEVSFSGFYESSDNLFTLTVDEVNDEAFGGTITLNLRSSDTLTVPEFTEITSLTESELNSVVMVLSTGATLLNQILG